ncbi:hypothetical protein C5B73_27680 [Nocardia cyriacigeorgica]|nr:hypothetical protein C5B73_27680 [Nocardia cyriacigeorgica]
MQAVEDVDFERFATSHYPRVGDQEHFNDVRAGIRGPFTMQFWIRRGFVIDTFRLDEVTSQ